MDDSITGSEMPRLSLNASVCETGIFSNYAENLKYLGIVAYSVPGILVNLRLLYVICVSQKKIYLCQPFFVFFALDLGNFRPYHPLGLLSTPCAFLPLYRFPWPPNNRQLINPFSMSQCNSSYPVFPENVKYFVQLSYLAPGGVLQMRILWVLWIAQRKIYSKSSFFRIWAMDSTVSLMQILIDVSFSRVHIYFPQFCPAFSMFLETYWLIPHITYPLYIYTFTAKTIIHSILSVNRMTCVITPLKYSQMWSVQMTKVTCLILIYPFFILWNVIISEKYLDYIFGGFVISYRKRVQWASLSRFAILSFIITLSTTFITTVITLSKMAKLKKRLLNNEKHLCIATAWISIGFVIALVAQVHFAWFQGNPDWSQVFYIVQCVSFDLLNVGYSVLWENLKYLVQMIYLLPAAILEFRILYLLLWKYKTFYLKQSFYVLFSMDCLACFILVVQDVLFARVFQYFPQFCEPLSGFVKAFPLFPIIYYPLQQHLHCAQPVIQVLLTLNRMSCVLFPWKYSQFWDKWMKFAILLVLIFPFFFIWNIIISPKTPIYTFGGFYIGYERVVSWATMSLFLMILRAITIIITAICTFITVLRLSQMSKRLVSSERTLCIASFLISSCFLGTAGAESLFAFSVVRTSQSIQYFLLPISWDILNVGTPIVMVLASRQLRGHVFGRIPKLSRSNSRGSNKVEDGVLTTITL